MDRPHSRSRRKREARRAERAARRKSATPAPVAWLDIPRVLRDWRDEPAARRHSALARTLGILAAVVAASVGILLLVPLLIEFVFMARSPVAVVNGTKIEAGVYALARDFRRYEIIREINQLVAYRADGTAATAPERQAVEDRINERRFSLSSADFQAVEDLINVIGLKEKAEQEGIVIPAEDVRVERESVLAAPPRPTPSVAGAIDRTVLKPTIAEAAPPDEPLEDRLRTLLSDLGMPRDLFDDLITARVVEHIFLKRAEESVADVQPHVHLKQIVAATEEEAASYIKRYNAGVSWSVLARESLNQGLPDAPPAANFDAAGDADLADSNDGDLGFVPRGILEATLDDAAFSLDAGSVSDPISAAGEFHLLLVVAKADSRAVSSEHLRELRRNAIVDFRGTLRESATVEYQLDSGKVQWASRHGLRNVGELDPDSAAGGAGR